MTKEFDDMLNFDALYEAEKMTGKSYKDDDDTRDLGIAMFLAKNKLVSEELALRNDTHHRVSWQDALSIYEDLGFVEIFSETFADNTWNEKKEETFKVFWRDGFLLTAESYWGHKSLNSSKIYYNWIPKDEKTAYQFTSSGSYDKNADDVLVWSGDHDAREGLRNIIDNLENNGEILSKWEFVPFLWLLNFSVTKDKNYDYEKENARVVSHFPKDVQEAIKYGAIDR